MGIEGIWPEPCACTEPDTNVVQRDRCNTCGGRVEYADDRPEDPRPRPRPPDHRFKSGPQCPVPGRGNAEKCLSKKLERYVSDDWCNCVCHKAGSHPNIGPVKARPINYFPAFWAKVTYKHVDREIGVELPDQLAYAFGLHWAILHAEEQVCNELVSHWQPFVLWGHSSPPWEDRIKEEYP